VGMNFRNALRELVEENRTKKGVKEFDLYELSV
jgi:quinol monooxygenase YgiN